jgi:hypothetical protein
VDSCRVDEKPPPPAAKAESGKTIAAEPKPDPHVEEKPPPPAAKAESEKTIPGEPKRDPDYALRAVFNSRASGKLRVVNDSFYRFRMVGKASALFNDIHFESGVLRAEQIDPFGTAIIYDDSTRSYRIEAASTARQRAQRKLILDETEELRQLYKTLKDMDPHFSKLKDEIGFMLKNKIEQGYGNGQIFSSKANEGDNELRTTCPEGRPAKRSYLLYGPEGVREVDPDERLLMAMSSDSKPLVSLLQQLSEKRSASRTQHIAEFQAVAEERALIHKLDEHINASIANEANPTEVVQQLIAEIKKHTSSNNPE